MVLSVHDVAEAAGFAIALPQDVAVFNFRNTVNELVLPIAGHESVMLGVPGCTLTVNRTAARSLTVCALSSETSTRASMVK